MTMVELREANRRACAQNYERNKERRNAYQREYYQRNREELSLNAMLRNMGLLPKRPRRGRPRKGEPTNAELVAEITPEQYAKRVAEYEENRRHKRIDRALQKGIEKLEAAGYTVTKEATK